MVIDGKSEADDMDYLLINKEIESNEIKQKRDKIKEQEQIIEQMDLYSGINRLKAFC